MIIPIDSKHRISSDAYQWILQEYSSFKKGGGVWKNVGYWNSLEPLLNSLFDRKLRQSPVEGIAEATLEAKSIATTLSNALKPLFRVESQSKEKSH